MTTFVCRSCGGHWNEGPTRDNRIGEDCRYCAWAEVEALRKERIALRREVAELKAPTAALFVGLELRDERDSLRKRVAGLEAERGRYRQGAEFHCGRAERMRDILKLILPLAKGYAAKHPVGANQTYVALAEKALEPYQHEDLAATERDRIVQFICDSPHVWLCQRKPDGTFFTMGRNKIKQALQP